MVRFVVWNYPVLVLILVLILVLVSSEVLL